MSNKPYLSIVVCGRNDNYGGDFIQRLQRFFDWNVALLEKYRIKAEIIFVNWNPVAENPPIEQLIAFPESRTHTRIRIIEAPNSVHQHYVQPETRKTVPIFEFIAKNAGIRRAEGEYILCVNADVLIHQDIFQFIGKKLLNPNYYYRANRLDFKTPKAFNNENYFWEAGYVVSLKGFMYNFKSESFKKLQYLYFKIFNYFRIKWELWKFKHEKFCRTFCISVIYDNAAFYAHCLNSGDFMLAHQTCWVSLKSYPENTFISTHTDAIFTHLAYNKLHEHVFAAPVFHQEHERRYQWDAIKNEEPFRSAYHHFENIAKKLLSGEENTAFLNGESWGLKDFLLTEKVF